MSASVLTTCLSGPHRRLGLDHSLSLPDHLESLIADLYRYLRRQRDSDTLAIEPTKDCSRIWRILHDERMYLYNDYNSIHKRFSGKRVYLAY